MNPGPSLSAPGRVASLHLHPLEAGTPMQSVTAITVFREKGILGNERYFGRQSRSTGRPSQRQISLIEREQIAEHATVLGLQTIAPGAVRANIETLGINLQELMGLTVLIGEALVLIRASRTPCAKMDLICLGLRSLMENSRQGVLAEVLQSGKIRVGDLIRPAPDWLQEQSSE